MAAARAAGSSSSGVMSRNTTPGLGKSGMSRIWARRSTEGTGRSLAKSELGRDLAQVADQQQMLEMGGDRREVLEGLDRLLAALGIARAQRGSEDALQQLRLAIGGAAEHAQIAPADAIPSQLGHRPDDLAFGLVVVARPAARLALDPPEVDELAHQAGLSARLLHHVLERVQGPGVAYVDDRVTEPAPLARGRRDVALRPSAGELLADHPQREELVALQAQDRPQALDVALRVETVAALRPARREQLLILEVADLGDRDVGELLVQRLADGADRDRLLARRVAVVVGRVRKGDYGLGGVSGGHQRLRNASLYLPICSSSPSLRRWESI